MMDLGGQSSAGCLFDEKNPKNRCLCGRCHVVTGTRVLLALFIMSTTLYAFGLAFGLQSLIQEIDLFFILWGAILFGFIWLIILLFIIICTFVALKKQDSRLMWPILIFEGFFFVCFITAAIAIPVDYYLLDSRMENDFFIYYIISTIATPLSYMPFYNEEHDMAYIEFCSIVALLVSFWLMTIIYRCMEYFKDKSITKRNSMFPGALKLVQAQQRQHIGNEELQIVLDNDYNYDEEQPPPYSTMLLIKEIKKIDED